MNSTLSLTQRIEAFSKLGIELQLITDNISGKSVSVGTHAAFENAIENAGLYNQWFTKPNVLFALNSWANELTNKKLLSWTKKYPELETPSKGLKVAVIMAGNIPLVGFHDFLCVLISGNHFVGKLSSDDEILLPAVADLLCEIEPGFKPSIEFTSETLKKFDAVIATGSNNSARYFEYYFSKYPNIIRKNRNGVAVLHGDENEETLLKIGSDISLFFGLGCRNISKVFLPQGTNPEFLLNCVKPYFEALNMHNKYMNNYSYQRSILLLNQTFHLDNGVLILTESESYSSPISVIHYEFYNSIEKLKQKLTVDKENIQCVVSEQYTIENAVSPGNSQRPGLSDYADGIDTINFLINLEK